MDELVPAPCELAILRERARARVNEDGRAAGRDVVHSAGEGLWRFLSVACAFSVAGQLQVKGKMLTWVPQSTCTMTAAGRPQT